MVKDTNRNQIVITGIAGNFPNSENVSELYSNLKEKKHLFSPMDNDWKVFVSNLPLHIGRQQLKGDFDSGFFGVHHKEAESMHPSCRKLLEVSVEAIMDSGTNPRELRNSKTGVFVVSSDIDSKTEWNWRKRSSPDYTLFGVSNSLLAEKISYHLQVQGPSICIDSACASSLYALDHAVKCILSGKCDNALVCGFNVVQNPNTIYGYMQLGVLNSFGHVNVFDESCTGYVKGEATAAIYIQKLQNAKRVYAEILSIKTNCDGFKEMGITHPSSDAMVEVIDDAYREIGIAPCSVDFVECHVTGTKPGFVEEIRAIERTFCSNRNKLLPIGSVKTSIGHAEQASGLTSLIKILIGLQYNCVLPSLDYERIKPFTNATGKITIPTKHISLPTDQDIIISCSNSGFGGSNAHLVVKQRCKTRSNALDVNRLVCFSARTMSSLTKISESISDCSTEEYLTLLQNLFRRSHPDHWHRGYVIFTDRHFPKKSLAYCDEKLQLCLVYPPGTQNWLSFFGRIKEYSVASKSVTRIQNVLEPQGVDVSKFWSCEVALKTGDLVLATIALQIVVTDVIRELVSHQSFLVDGSSSGVIVAAYAQNEISLNDCLSMVLEIRGRLMNVEKIEHKCTNTITKKELRDVYKKLSTKDDCSLFLENFNSNLAVNKVKFIVGSKTDDEFGCEPNTNFLQILGRLYTYGFDLNLDTLYPSMPFPVKTPFISPLIQWQRNYDWPVFKYELKQLNKLIITIGLDHADWKFLAAHDIDGHILFPGTAYLAVAWDCYLKLNHLVKDETKIIFENVKFHRMTVLSKEKPLVLTVEYARIQNGFEIKEGEECLVTGRIHSTAKSFKFVRNRSPILPKESMNDRDIYKKLTLHGYNFKNEFRCIQEASIDGTTGCINWTDNWTTFLDGMQHFTVLNKKLDYLYVPLHIEQLIIDPQKHAQALTENKNLLPIYYDKKSSIVTTPGVELRSLMLTNLKKRSEKVPVLETYKFVPLQTELSLEDSMMIHVQLIVENVGNSLSVIEVVDSFTNNQLLSPIIEDVLTNEFKVNTNFSIYSNKVHKETTIDVTKKTFKDLPNDVDLVVMSSGTKRPQMLDQILQNRNCFVLSREAPSFESSDRNDVVSLHKTNQDFFVLLRRRFNFDKKILHVDSEFMWLDQLKSAMSRKEQVILIVENDTTNGIVGLIRCLKQEVELNVSCMFLTDASRKFDDEDAFFQKQLQKNLLINVLKGDQWGTYRFLPLSRRSSESCRNAVCVTSGGDLSNVHYVEDKLVIRILVLNVTDYRSNVVRLGCEFSGTGPRGQRVMGLVPDGCFSYFVSMDKSVTCPVPDDWSLEDAATAPVSYLTILNVLMKVSRIRDHFVYLIYLKICRLKSGQSVLVHSGTGGLGLSTINVCMHFNCDLFVTVGSKQKQNYLRRLYPAIPDSHIGCSRDTTFEQMIMKQTKGRGVDVVINFLTEDKLQASLRCLALRGIFVELGKYDSQLNNPIPFTSIGGRRTCVGGHLDSYFDDGPNKFTQLVSFLKRGIKDGYVKPLPRTIYDKDKVQDALTYMSSGNHTGKILLKFKDESNKLTAPVRAVRRFFCDAQKVYVIVGGLGGFGLELIDWLISRGARKLIAVSRNGATTGYQRFKLKQWNDFGCKILQSQDDLADENGCADLLKKSNLLGVVDGIFILSVVLHDALFEYQTKETFKLVFESKSVIIKNLDAVSRKFCPYLSQFVVFSSIVCGRGNSGQANYGMANSVGERICEERKSEGHPGLAIQWGAIGEVGVLAEKLSMIHDIVGVLEQKISSCLNVLDTFLTQNEVIVSSTVYESKKKQKTADSKGLLNDVAKILDITNVKHVSLHSTLSSLGMDSTTTTQLRQFLVNEYNMYFTAKELRNTTLHTLEQKIVK
ncbi:hypothetical protein FQR65_LT11342 [Abscondita terminalis]|nr:hypothetical protein FQR65_LT11342 [Abscondita terminalis]